MDLKDFEDNIGRIIDEINETREQELVLIASNTYALIRRRIQLEAQDSEGNKFGDYSEAVVPRWMLTSMIKKLYI